MVDGDDGGGAWLHVLHHFEIFRYFTFFKSRLLTGAMDSKISISIVIVGGHLATSFSY